MTFISWTSVRSRVSDIYALISQISYEKSLVEKGVIAEQIKRKNIEYMEKGVLYSKEWLGEGFDTGRIYLNFTNFITQISTQLHFYKA